MRKPIAALAMILAASQAAAQEAAQPKPKLDVCGTQILGFMVKKNYEVECLKLGRISIDELATMGYRVTASFTVPGGSTESAHVGLFIEKTDK